MRRKITRILLTISLIIGVWLVWMVVDLVAKIAGLIAKLVPASEPYVLWGLLIALAVTAVWFFLSFIFKPGAIIVPDDPSLEDLERLRRKLARRLRRNPYLRDAGLDLDTPEGLEAGLKKLRDLSNTEIKSTAQAVFLTTAISRNGRLDSLTVIVGLLRLVWRLTHIYGGRPSLREINHIYMNVAYTAAFAFAIEDFDLTDHVGAVVGNTVSSIPGAPPIAALITAAIMDGSINAFLVIRVGVLTQKYLSVDVQPHQKPSRQTSLRAFGMLTEVSSSAALPVAKMLLRISHTAAKSSARKAVGLATSTVRKTSEAVTKPWSSLFKRKPKDI